MKRRRRTNVRRRGRTPWHGFPPRANGSVAVQERDTLTRSRHSHGLKTRATVALLLR